MARVLFDIPRPSVGLLNIGVEEVKGLQRDDKTKAAPAKPVVVKRREDWLDLAWSLLNSTEFLYHH